MKTNWSLTAALAAAGLSAACCTIPLILVSVGVGGAWLASLAALAPYRWVFVAIAGTALGAAGYNEWRLHRRPDCDCETIFSSTTRRLMLGLWTLAVAGIVVSPWLIAPASTAAPQHARASAAGTEQSGDGATPTSVEQVVLSVEGMTCATCPKSVQTALMTVDGVHEANVTYEPPRAVVRFDPQTTSVEALTQATERAGYPSHRTAP